MIDNTKYYNDTLAYDFEMFMEKPKKEKPDNIIKMKQAPKRKIKAKPKRSPLLFVGIGAILVYLLIGIQIRVSINEVNTEINSIKREINELDAEKTVLEMQVEEIISYENISSKATELGMVKASKDQIRYIKINDRDKAVGKNGKEMYSEKSSESN